MIFFLVRSHTFSIFCWNFIWTLISLISFWIFYLFFSLDFYFPFFPNRSHILDFSHFFSRLQVFFPKTEYRLQFCEKISRLFCKLPSKILGRDNARLCMLKLQSLSLSCLLFSTWAKCFSNLSVFELTAIFFDDNCEIWESFCHFQLEHQTLNLSKTEDIFPKQPSIITFSAQPHKPLIFVIVSSCSHFEQNWLLSLGLLNA